ncbi:ZF-HD homeobox protein [Iris pallida]|uniref:ZF-HD homeobox protein n=1 Tax=Iris pallida TaxID=29817 RepID=A0AAX6FXS1_IRIPA|nr:ZF-HD homeobox protein [Iris pallida]
MMELSIVPFGEPGGGESYRECMRNHAASIGGQAYDGCGEFMPGGDAGTAEALKCAACGCHRNFHRRDHNHHHHHQKPIRSVHPFQHVFRPAVPYRQAAGSRAGSETPPRTERKRNRTKFTAEQKEKMAAFAERSGWRIPRHDDPALRGFLEEIGVERHVLKVWMHNNKSHLAAAAGGVGVKTEAAASAPAAISV